MSKNVFKNIFINILVLIGLITFLELSSGLGRLFVGKQVYIPFFKIQKNFNSRYPPYHPCMEMKTDVLLSHIPNHKNKCEIKNGKAIGEYVVYDYSLEENPMFLVLGGSTSSGFYQNFANGNNWPMYLAESISKNYYLINGAVGGYSSTQEFIKFLRDASRFRNLKFIISLNGTNELPNYHGQDDIRAFEYPSMTNVQYLMNKNQKWRDQRYYRNFFSEVYDVSIPNTKSLVSFLSGLAGATRITSAQLKVFKKTIKKKKISEIKEKKIKFFQAVYAADRWEDNVNRINIIAKSMGIKYLVFLQPRLGLSGPQSIPAKASNDEILFNDLSDEYFIKINSSMNELKKRCLKIEFCIDITDVAIPTGNVYKDASHHNSNGNKIIAEEIFNYLKKQVDFIE